MVELPGLAVSIGCRQAIAKGGAPYVGCCLNADPQERLVWTDALGPGYRPTDHPFMTGILSLRDVAGGTEHTARAMHRDPATRRTHEAMGFHDEWNSALDQLLALIGRA